LWKHSKRRRGQTRRRHGRGRGEVKKLYKGAKDSANIEQLYAELPIITEESRQNPENPDVFKI
jgi:hypothetical protein